MAHLDRLCVALLLCGGCRALDAAVDGEMDAAVRDGGAPLGDASGGEGDAGHGRRDDAGACLPVIAKQGECRDTNDCTNASQQCRFPEDQLCGNCRLSSHACVVGAAPCGLGGVCVEVTYPCSCDGPSTECATDCRTTSGCADKERCDQATGVCTADCMSGAADCPSDATCKPDDPSADESGCVRQTCKVDGDCSCGNICARGRCYEAFGLCGFLPA